MTELSSCKHCGGEAVLQTRSGMKPADHRQPDPNYEHELHDGNRDDIRVACVKCGHATGWNKRDQPGMPGVGIGFMQNLWNEGNG